jgi:hypothetical protein
MAGMTRRILLATAVLCVIFAGVVLAADISGNWSGTMQMGDNPLDLTFVFKQDGEKLTGTVATPSGDLPLSEGKVVGDKISFFVMADMGGTPTKFISSGVVKGDEITIATKTDAGEDYGSMVLKRVK